GIPYRGKVPSAGSSRYQFGVMRVTVPIFAMTAAEFAATGALLMSWRQALSEGKSCLPSRSARAGVAMALAARRPTTAIARHSGPGEAAATGETLTRICNLLNNEARAEYSGLASAGPATYGLKLRPWSTRRMSAPWERQWSDPRPALPDRPFAAGDLQRDDDDRQHWMGLAVTITLLLGLEGRANRHERATGVQGRDV